jgi:hypothetical protein
MQISLAFLLCVLLAGCGHADSYREMVACTSLLPSPELPDRPFQAGMAVYRECADRVEARAARQEREEGNARAGWRALGEGLNSSAASLRAGADFQDRAVATPPPPRESTVLPMPPPIEPVEVNPPSQYMAPAECLNHILVGGHC